MKSQAIKQFGMLRAIQRLPGSKYHCVCNCGNTRVVPVGHFNAGYYISCGCHVTRHGHAKNGAKSREYVAYHNMISRCHNPRNSRFQDYGGRGIKVCKRWRKSFASFLEDMGLCPKGMQIDRIDNEQGYSPENCRWVERKTNQRNRSCSYYWVVDGEKFETAGEAAKANGVSPSTINAWCRGRVSEGRHYPPKTNCSIIFRY